MSSTVAKILMTARLMGIRRELKSLRLALVELQDEYKADIQTQIDDLVLQLQNLKNFMNERNPNSDIPVDEKDESEDEGDIEEVEEAREQI